MTRKLPLAAFAAAQCAFLGLAAAAPAHAAGVPGYFFKEWTVTANCTEAHAGPAAHVAAGLKFSVSPSSLAADGSYTLVTTDAGGQKWAAEWNGIKLQYRAGTPMTAVPADFECVAGSESQSTAASPFLAMSGFVQTAEPQYAQQHWYGLATIHGQLEHVLIFPRAAQGDKSAIIVLLSASTSSTVQLDDNGVINSKD
ncbi:MAG TPA: hypothetical protein VHB68_12005 [Steroidobacteraceae bacterium]|nr:hypothetical protein [Steroidobacteraceae bacterium]